MEGVRTDVRVANMSLLSTDWHINQMKKRAYESDPLPIKLRESVYRSGNRDYVLVNSTDNTKLKGNSLRLKTQEKFSQLKADLSKTTSAINNSEFLILIQKAYWLNDVALALEKDKKDYKSKELNNQTVSIIQKFPQKNTKQKPKFLASVRSNKSF